MPSRQHSGLHLQLPWPTHDGCQTVIINGSFNSKYQLRGSARYNNCCRLIDWLLIDWAWFYICTTQYTVWVKKIPPPGDLTFFFIFHKRLTICNRFFTHLLNVSIFAILQIFIQLSPILTKLCHIKRDYPVHVICAKCPKRAKTHAFRRLRKWLIALLIVVCGKSL